MSKSKDPVAPICPHCNRSSVLTTGREIYPHIPRLHAKSIWICRPCEAYVGCHGDTTKPLGTPAKADLRAARSKLHEQMFDPLWKTAVQSGGYKPESERAANIIKRAARKRCYTWLSEHMGMSVDDCHISMFNIEQCRTAWTLLRRVDYPEIRSWYKARFPKPEKEAA